MAKFASIGLAVIKREGCASNVDTFSETSDLDLPFSEWVELRYDESNKIDNKLLNSMIDSIGRIDNEDKREIVYNTITAIAFKYCRDSGA